MSSTRLAALIVSGLVLATACSSSDDEAAPSTVPITTTTLAPLTDPVAPETLDIDLTDAARCDPLAPSRCLLPFPNDYYTVGDDSTPTGLRVALVSDSLPANIDGKHIDPAEFNRLDGFSPGAAILVPFEIELDPTQLATVADISKSMTEAASIVIVDATSGNRLPYWAELDANAPDGEFPTLIVRPAKNWKETHRIVVGIRTLHDRSGGDVATSSAFAAYRDRVAIADPAFEARRDHMEDVFSVLSASGVERDELTLAWDFTIASSNAITARMLHIRDEAFAELGSAAPSFTVDQIEVAAEPTMLRRITGTFQVPNFLSGTGSTGSQFVLDEGGLPTRGEGFITARYQCTIPAGATPDEPVRMSLYGHGLFGDMGEVNSDIVQSMADRFDIAYCATDWIGMAEEDIVNAATILQDLSRFPTLADRSQQGFLNFLYLGRLLIHAEGLSAHPAFSDDATNEPLLDRAQLFYDGNSQGAILGGSLCAVAQDFTRCVLGEAGMNYSTLLHRSVDFDDYKLVFDPSYPDEFDQLVGISLIQMLWDRSETNGYAQHLSSDPLPGTPPHQVLLLGAYGDHQVSEWSLQVEARTIGAFAHEPYVAKDRQRAKEYGFGLKPVSDGDTGGAYFLFDTGSPASPFENLPPREGHDPHDDTPLIPEAQEIKDAFMRPDGAIVDACGAAPCVGQPAE
jgi:hypothetical protein